MVYYTTSSKKIDLRQECIKLKYKVICMKENKNDQSDLNNQILFEMKMSFNYLWTVSNLFTEKDWEDIKKMPEHTTLLKDFKRSK